LRILTSDHEITQPTVDNQNGVGRSFDHLRAITERTTKRPRRGPGNVATGESSSIRSPNIQESRAAAQEHTARPNED
jgi:hypothetical protein